jgi:hypothetical protein
MEWTQSFHELIPLAERVSRFNDYNDETQRTFGLA